MGEVILFWVLIAIATVLALIGIVGGGLRLRFGKHFRDSDLLLLLALFLALQLGGIAAILTTDSGLYVREAGPPITVTVDRLTYISGSFGLPGWVRVDTSRGIYFLSARDPVPYAGTVYRVARTRPWGGSQWVFLCPRLPPVDCWPTKQR